MKRQRGSLSATTPTEVAKSRPEPPPAMVGRFIIEEVIGRGGMSDVYRAFDPELNRHVALKVLAPALGRNPEFTDRFIRESRAAAKLNHAHVVPIFEAGSDGDTLFIAMHLVRGVDLKSYIETNGPLELGELRSVMRQAASALDHAHDHGLLHRDVKPANFMLEERNGELHVYLTDFGLTKSLGTDSRITHTGELVGSVHYVSPEHLEGRELDTRTDVYSLGCVLHECLSGRPPFERDTDMAVLWAHLNAEVPRASRMRRHVPNVVDRVVARAMAKDPRDRFPTCGGLADSLVAALDGIALDLPVPGRKTVVPLLARLRSLSGVVVTALLLVGSIFLATHDWSEPFFSAPSSGTEESRDQKRQGDRVQVSRDGDAERDEIRRKDRDGEGPRERSLPGFTRGRPSSGSVTVAATGPSSREQTLATRTEKGQYDLTSGDLEGLNDSCASEAPRTGCVQFIAASGESYLDIVISDRVVKTVGAFIKLDLDNNGDFDGGWKRICDVTTSPLRIREGARVQVLIDPDACSGSSKGTTGVVTARFYRATA